MKKFLVLAIALVMVGLTVFTACNGKKDNNTTIVPAQTAQEPAVAQTGNNNAGSGKSGELYEIRDEQIIAYKVSLEDFKQTVITGEQRTEMLAAIPAQMKKGIGKIYLTSVQENTATGEGYLLGLTFTECSKDDYKTLCEYYKSLGGTITTESDIQLNIGYDWGELSDCAYAIVQKDTITVSFSTK
jgi:hypothetical protein